jgi:hypothetical protein
MTDLDEALVRSGLLAWAKGPKTRLAKPLDTKPQAGRPWVPACPPVR